MGSVQAKKKTGKLGTSPLAVFLIALAIAALSLGGWIAWSYWGSNVLAQRAAADELVGLRNAIAEATPTAIETDEAPQVARPATGTAAWIVRIPAIGLEAPVIAGVEPSDLNRGLGWYPGTSLPGQAGNFALAGNRVTGGAFLRDVMSLAAGDQVTAEQMQNLFGAGMHPLAQQRMDEALAAILADDFVRARWSANALAFAETADIYSNAEHAADVILKERQ